MKGRTHPLSFSAFVFQGTRLLMGLQIRFSVADMPNGHSNYLLKFAIPSSGGSDRLSPGNQIGTECFEIYSLF